MARPTPIIIPGGLNSKESMKTSSINLELDKVIPAALNLFQNLWQKPRQEAEAAKNLAPLLGMDYDQTLSIIKNGGGEALTQMVKPVLEQQRKDKQIGNVLDTLEGLQKETQVPYGSEYLPNATKTATVPTFTPDIMSKLKTMMQIGGAIGGDFSTGIENALGVGKKTAEESTIGRVEPDKFTPESITKFQQTGSYSDLMPVEKSDKTTTTSTEAYVKQADGTTDKVEYTNGKEVNRIKGVTVPETGTNINMPAGQKQEDIEMSKLNVSRYEGNLKAYDTSRMKYDNMKVAQRLMQNAEQGTLSGAKLGVAQIFQSMGLEVNPKWDDTSALKALSNQLAMEARDTSEGKGLSGNTSDRDLQFLKSSTIGIEKMPNANKIVSDILMSKAKREMDITKLATDYYEAKGNWKGWNDYKQKWVDQHSLIDDIPSLQKADQYETGKVYKDAQGKKATYLGGGQWQPQ